MRGYLSLGAIFLYFAIAFYLEGKAWRHFKPGVSRRWYSRPLWQTHLFTEEGQEYRNRAISFYVFGGLVLIVFLVLLRIM
jgi:hypothetical protein